MKTQKLKVTSNAVTGGALRLTPCGKGFFPEDAFGQPSRNEGEGVHITIHASGLPDVIHTDIPTDRAGRPRWFFRNRRWFRQFAAVHEINAGDEIIISRLSDRDYRVSPVFKNIRFIDLFAGIGGTRLGFEAAGARCVYSCEWDKHSRKTYETNFGDIPAGDIRFVNEKEIPDHEILVAGFPCQPFSIAGVTKKNALGHKHGFLDKTQGTLFFDLARIIAEKQPRAFVLENVKNLLSHDKGKTFAVILNTLEHELGYQIDYKVINAA